MNPNASVDHELPDGKVQAPVAGVVEAIERASEWELFDTSSLPSVPRWVGVVIGAAFVLAGLASLVGALWGGPS